MRALSAAASPSPMPDRQPDRPRRPPPWRASRAVPWAGALLGLAVLAVVDLPVLRGAELLLAIAAVTLLAWRSLRSREAARAALDEAQAAVARRERELSVTIKSEIGRAHV